MSIKKLSAFLFGCLCLCALISCSQDVSNYPELTKSITVIEGTPGKWDEKKVHTMSIIEDQKDGYKYWGYYALDYYGRPAEMRKGGLVRSNDMVHWVKYEGNPIVDENCRWPTVVKSGSIYYMFYAEYNTENDSRIVRLSSNDGIHFDNKVEIVAEEEGRQNQNPFIFFNPEDDNYYLYYYSGRERGSSVDNEWSIKVKSASTVDGITKAAPKTIMSDKRTIAAPSVAYYNGSYYLLIEAVETYDGVDKWVTLGYVSSSPDKNFKEVENNPILQNDDACAFQYVIGNELYITYSHRINANNDWIMKTVKAKK